MNEPSREPKTAGIAPALSGSLSVLQFTPALSDQQVLRGTAPLDIETQQQIETAAHEISNYHPPGDAAKLRHQRVAEACQFFLQTLVLYVPAGPQRSTAISRLQEARMWGNAGIALDGK